MAIKNYTFATGDKVKIVNMYGLKKVTNAALGTLSADNSAELAHVPFSDSLVITTSDGTTTRVLGTDYTIEGNVVTKGTGTLLATDVATYLYETESDVEKVWNTGLSAADEPHADEPATLAGQAIITDPFAFVAQGIAQIRLFKTNQAVLLNPGDTFTIAPQSAAEFFYYAGIVDAYAEVSVIRA